MGDPASGRDGPPALRAGELIQGAAAHLRDNAQPLAVIWLVWAAVIVAVQWGASSGDALTRIGPRYGAYVLVSGLVNGVFVVAATRVLLGRPEHAWQPDGGFLKYLGWVVVTSVATALYVMAIGTAPAAGAQAPPEELAAYGGRALIVLLATPVAIWALLRLTLWPVGMIMNDPGLTLGRSWRLMRRAVWPFILASLALGLGPGMLTGVASIEYAASRAFPWLLLSGAAAALSTLIGAAVATEVYRARLGGDVGKVFE